MKRILSAAVLVSASFGASLSAQAGLLGSTVTLDALFPDVSTVFSTAGSHTVDGSVEFPAGSIPGYPPISAQITDTQIIIASDSGTSYAAASFNGFEFAFTGAPSITAVTVDGASNLVPVGVSFISDEVLVNFEGLSVTPSTVTVLDVNSTVPEPTSLALVGTAILGLGLLRLRKTV